MGCIVQPAKSLLELMVSSSEAVLQIWQEVHWVSNSCLEHILSASFRAI